MPIFSFDLPQERKMWTLVYKVKAEEYDAFPNSWIVSESLSWYPDKGPSTSKRMATDAIPPVENSDEWLQLEIKLEKKDYGE